MQPRLDDRWTFTRNKSWRQSARIGLEFGLWLFPSSLVNNVADDLNTPLLAKRNFSLATAPLLLAFGLGILLFSAVKVVFSHLVFIGFGLAGFIAEQVPTK